VSRRLWKALITLGAGSLSALLLPGCRASVTISSAPYLFGGWGTSLAWWPEQLKVTDAGSVDPAIVDALFSVDGTGSLGVNGPGTGLGLNVLRFNLGASPENFTFADGRSESATGRSGKSSPGAVASTCPTQNPAQSVPSLQQARGGQPSLTNDPFQTSVLKAALHEIAQSGNGSAVVEAFANSPPWWLLRGGQANLGCADAALGETLPWRNDKAYAQYLAASVTALDRAVRVKTVEPFNEPNNQDGGWGAKCKPSKPCQEGSNFSPDQEANIIGDLCADIKGSDTGVSVTDGNTASETDSQIKSLGLAGLDCVTQINTHSYQGPTTSSSDGGRAELSTEIDRVDPALSSEKSSSPAMPRVSMSEYAPGCLRRHCSNKAKYTARRLAATIASDLNELQPRYWVYWQALDPAQGWRLIYPKRLTPSSNYWVLYQYSHFIRPGYTIYPDLHDPSNIVVAHEGHTTVVVVADHNHFQVNLTKIGVPDAATVQGFATTDGAPTEPLPASEEPTISGGELTGSTRDHQIATYVIKTGTGVPGPTTAGQSGSVPVTACINGPGLARPTGRVPTRARLPGGVVLPAGAEVYGTGFRETPSLPVDYAIGPRGMICSAGIGVDGGDDMWIGSSALSPSAGIAQVFPVQYDFNPGGAGEESSIDCTLFNVPSIDGTGPCGGESKVAGDSVTAVPTGNSSVLAEVVAVAPGGTGLGTGTSYDFPSYLAAVGESNGEFAQVATCALPVSQRATCRAALDLFVSESDLAVKSAAIPHDAPAAVAPFEAAIGQVLGAT